MYGIFFEISARFFLLRKYTLTAGHYSALFPVTLLIALNMLSWLRPHLQRKYAKYKYALLASRYLNFVYLRFWEKRHEYIII